MEKKPYTPPTLVDHGSVVTATKGAFGYSFEPMGEMVRMDTETMDVPASQEKK